VELGDNNGDAISCIVLLVDSLARENESLVVIETLHEDGCSIFGYVGEGGQNKDMIGDHKPTSDEALAHLYACNCDTNIEVVFTNGDEESLLVSFTLSDMKDTHSWLNDENITKDMLKEAKEVGDDSPLMQTLKPVFKKRVGTNLGVTLDSFDMTLN
tara:strand:+ start:389 stop:859 length:471 start_codon:yes stop_codon:yes gene_type:complete